MGNKVATGSPLQRGIDRKNISWPVGRPPEVLLSRASVSNKEGGVAVAAPNNQRNSTGNNLWIIERSPVAGDDDGGPSAAKIVKVRRLLPDEAPPASARRSRLYSSLRNSTCVETGENPIIDPEVTPTRERARSVSPEKLKPPVEEEKEHVVLKKSTASCLWRRSKRSLRRVSLTKRRSYDVTAASTRNSGVLASTKLCTSTIEPSPQVVIENPFVKPRENHTSSPRKANHRSAVINDGVLQNFLVDEGSFEDRGESPCEEDLIYANDQADDSSIPFEFEASSTSSSDSGEGFDFFDETATSFSDDERHEALSGDEYADLCQCSDSGDEAMKPNYAYRYPQPQQTFAYLPPRSFDRNSCRVEKRNVVRNIYCVPRATRDSGFEDGEYFPVKPVSRSNLLLAPAHPAPPPPHATFSSSRDRSRQYSSSASEYWREDFVRRSDGDYYYDYEYEEDEDQLKSAFDFMSRPVAELTAPVVPRFQRDKLHTRSLGRVPKQRARTFVVPIDVDEDPPEQKTRPKKAPSHNRLMEDAEPRRAESAPIPHAGTSLGDFDVVQARHQLTFRRKAGHEGGRKSPIKPSGKNARNLEIYTIIITLVKRERLRPRRLGHQRWSSRDSNSPRSTPRSSPRNSRDYSNDFDEPDSGFRDGDHRSDHNRDDEQRSTRPSDGKDQSSGRCGRDTYSQEEILSLRQENERLMVQVRALQRDLDETKRRSKEALDRQAAELMGGSAQHIARMQRMDSELIAAKEALAALRADRKRLKAEKFELLSQMKQLYATLEDKDKELRDFIRNYEQRMQESEMSIRSLAGEREVVERERWNLLKHVREESERCVQLAAELGTKDAIVRQLQDELTKNREEKRLSNMSVGAGSDVEVGRDGDTNGGNDSSGQGPTSSSTLAGNGDTSAATDTQIPPLPSTPNGRMSSDRDSGVRGSSDRDSVGNTITGTLSDSAASQEGASGGRTSAGEPIYGECTSGGSGSSHYQAPYYCQTPTSYYSSQYYRKAAPSLLYASITSRDLSSINVGQQGGALSRSVEHIYSAPMGPPGDARKFIKPPPLSTSKSGLSVGGVGVGNGGTSASKGFGLGMKGTWGSISRVFSRTKNRKTLDSTAYFEAQLQADLNSINNERHSWSPRGSMCAPTSPTSSQQFRMASDSPSPSGYSETQSYSEKLRLLEEAQTLPLEQWRASTIQAWLELSLGMPQYAVGVAHNVKSGKVLLELSDSDLCNGLGISQPLHRKKLRLAIEEHRCPAICAQYPKMASLGHPWVALQWLQDIGLPQFAEVFAAHLIDGRMLEHLTKREMEKYLGVTRKFHQLSLFHAIHLLRMVQYDVQVLNDRRQGCDGVEYRDPLVWTNQRFIDWVRSIDLGEYAENLRESGVHGALVVLEESFTGDTMASALGIPNSKTIIRRHLAAELEALVNPARVTLEDEIKRAKTERRRADKLSLGGSLGRSFSRSYAGGLQESNSNKDKDKENSRSRTSLRGSISKAFGMRGSKPGDLNGPPGLSRMQNESEVEPELGDLSPNDDSLCSSPSEACLGGNNPPGDVRDTNGHLLHRQLSNDGGVSSPSTCHPPPPPPAPSSVTGLRVAHQKHRRGKSISETDSDSMLTVTPV